MVTARNGPIENDDGTTVRMPSGLRLERHLFARDRVVFSFVCFPYLSLPRIASYPANNPSSCDTGHTNQLGVPIMFLPAPSLLSFLLLSLSLLPLGQHLQTQRCYHAAISTLPFISFLVLPYLLTIHSLSPAPPRSPFRVQDVLSR